MRYLRIKTYIVLFLLCLISFNFVACNNSIEYDIEADYLKYHSQKEREIFDLSNGLKVSIDYIHKSNETNPTVMVQLTSTTYWMFESNNGYSSTSNAYSALYQWGNQSIDEKKADLRKIGSKFIEYAKATNWDNHYYLYVSLHTYCGDFIYDYECDKIWIPNQFDLQMMMYETFGTFEDSDLLHSSTGGSWLLENNLAKTIHGEIEINSNNFDYYNIYIDDEGNIYTRDKKSSSLN